MSFTGSLSKVGLGLTTLMGSAIALSSASNAAGDPRGIWYDHNGRGAVEIKECSSNPKRLCGHVVYVKQERHKKRCGTQIIGNLRTSGRGWIYSPKRGRSYPLALKKLSNNRLRIVGNAGSFFTKTYIWKRAPDDIANCNQPVVAKKAKARVIKAAAKPEPQPTKSIKAKVAPRTQEIETIEPGMTSSATAALLATPAVAPAPVETTEPEAPATASDNGEPVDDLTPRGGLSTGEGDKLGKLKSVIDKFTDGKGIKLSGKGQCKYRIPYVGRTIRVPCK